MGSDELHDLLWWLISPQNNNLEVEPFSMEPFSEKVIEVEFEIEQEVFHVHRGMITSGNMLPAAEANATYSVGESTRAGAILEENSLSKYQAGEIEIDLMIKHLGSDALVSPVLLVEEEEILLEDIDTGAMLEHSLTMEIDTPGHYTYSLALKDGEGALLDEGLLVFEVQERNSFHAVNELEQYLYQLHDHISIEAVILDKNWQPADVDYAVTVLTPSGNILESGDFIAEETGTHRVTITPEPAGEGYLLHPDEFCIVVEEMSSLQLEYAYREDGAGIKVLVTNEQLQPVAGAEIFLEEDRWITDKNGAAVIVRDAVYTAVFEAHKYPYYSEITRVAAAGDAVAEPEGVTYNPTVDSGVDITLFPHGRKVLKVGGRDNAGGVVELTPGVDYTVAANVYSIAASYLESTGLEEITLTFFMDGGIDPDVTVSVMEQTEKPVISTEAQTVEGSTITLEGTAEAYAEIKVTGGADVATSRADSDGYYSVAVPLQQDTENLLQVTAQSDGKSMSEAADIIITHRFDDCFIATAAYDSKLVPGVAILRQFRDAKLLTNIPGQAFVSFYYQMSPPIADYIAGNEALKMLVRTLLLPVVASAYLVMRPWLLLLAVLIVFVAVYCRRKTACM